MSAHSHGFPVIFQRTQNIYLSNHYCTTYEWVTHKNQSTMYTNIKVAIWNLVTKTVLNYYCTLIKSYSIFLYKKMKNE